MLLSKINTFFYVVFLFVAGLCSQPSISADKVPPYFVFDGNPIEIGNFDSERSAFDTVYSNEKNNLRIILDGIFLQKNRLCFYVAKEILPHSFKKFTPRMQLCYAILDDQTKVVSCVDFSIITINTQEKLAGMIDDLRVTSDIHARKGFGRYLLTRACSFLFSLDVSDISLLAQPAPQAKISLSDLVQFYKSVGFCNESVQPEEQDTEAVKSVPMRLKAVIKTVGDKRLVEIKGDQKL